LYIHIRKRLLVTEMLENTFLFKREYFIISKIKIFISTIFTAATSEFPKKYTRIIRRFRKRNYNFARHRI